MVVGVAPARWRADSGADSELAAVVMRLDGCCATWRDHRLQDDEDVTTWSLHVLRPDQDYASLFWGELEQIRARRG